VAYLARYSFNVWSIENSFTGLAEIARIQEARTLDPPSGSVRTPSMVGSCPICGQPLKGKQTVCSPKCRIERSRRRREAERQNELAKVRLLLRDALRLLEEGTNE
jgi:predicted nucleic acid-binding Zn ribbon protein